MTRREEIGSKGQVKELGFDKEKYTVSAVMGRKEKTILDAHSFVVLMIVR